MKTIHKFRVHGILGDGNDPIRMPKGARILTVHEQGGNVCAWAEVDTEAPSVGRMLAIVGTGWKGHLHEALERARGGRGVALSGGVYVGTAFMPDGLVWHVVDCGEVA